MFQWPTSHKNLAVMIAPEFSDRLLKCIVRQPPLHHQRPVVDWIIDRQERVGSSDTEHNQRRPGEQQHQPPSPSRKQALAALKKSLSRFALFHPVQSVRIPEMTRNALAREAGPWFSRSGGFTCLRIR